MFEPKYTIRDSFTITISEIEHLTSRLKQSVIPMQVLTHIKKECLVALTHFSTQIEGNKLSLEQVSYVIEKHKTFGLVRDEREVINYFNLLEKIPNLIRKFNKKITKELILQCHSDLLDGIVDKSIRGNFRNVQNAIYDAKSSKLIYLPPESKDVEFLVEDLCNWVGNKRIHPIILAAIFHNQFVTIHPFIDGNGRSARLLSLYLLETKSYDWRQVVPVDRYYADNKSQYYLNLQQNYSHNYYFGRNKTDFTQWIEYYINGIQVILEGTINQIELYKTRNILLNNRQTKILKYLASNMYISASHYAKRFDISTRMATRDLKQLAEWGNLSIIGQARATKYFLK